MATITRDIERPAFLDRPAADDGAQLTFGAAVARRRESGKPPLSERLRTERGTSASAGSKAQAATRSGGATLDDMLVGAWEGLSAHHSVTCPVCTASMAPRVGAAGGACGDCGSQLR